jgi:DNA-binding CsgD family transcriptional regulator
LGSGAATLPLSFALLRVPRIVLTVSQRQALILVARGHSNAAISDQLALSPRNDSRIKRGVS